MMKTRQRALSQTKSMIRIEGRCLVTEAARKTCLRRYELLAGPVLRQTDSGTGAA